MSLKKKQIGQFEYVVMVCMQVHGIITLSTWMPSAEHRPVFSFFFFKEMLKFDIFIALFIWIQHEKYIQMGTNKPSIGLVVLEIAPWIKKKKNVVKFCTLKLTVTSVHNVKAS